MSPPLIGFIGILILFILLFFGIPIGVSLGLVAAAGLLVLAGSSGTLLKLAVTPFRLVADYNLSVLPLFLLMAQICAATGISRDLYNLAYKWFGRLPGGVAIASIGACALFAAISGSAIACAATIGSIAIPEMRRLKYADSLSTGTIVAGGTLGILIPPSFMFILYGILTETSIGALFIAGIIPGILQAFFYFTVIYLICTRKPELGPRGFVSTFKEKILAFKSCGEILALVVLVMVGIAVGWFTPTEAGAVGAGGAILFTVLRKRLTWKSFKEGCTESMKTTGMVFLLLVGAYIFTYFITLSNLPATLSNFITSLNVPPLVIIWVIIAIYMILGTAMEEASMMLLTIPIFTPIISMLGFNTIWFGVLVVRMMQIAMSSPPVGITLFIIKGIAPDIPISIVYKGVIPFIVADFFHIILIVFVPWLVMVLPDLMR